MTRGDTGQSPEVTAYLQRIGFTGAIDGSVETLHELQWRHLQTVPYENLDILRGIPLALEIPQLFEKIVHRRRGGYCFELNALFGWLLEELGYPVTHLFARFWRDEPTPPPKRRHHVLKVQAGGWHLCDVGVGGVIPRWPLRLQPGLEQPQGPERYRLSEHPQFGWMLEEFRHNQWERLYSFTEEPQLAKDFAMASYWCEHAPESIFAESAMVAIQTLEGRNTLAGRELRRFTSAGVQSSILNSDAEYAEALYTQFGIRLEG